MLALALSLDGIAARGPSGPTLRDSGATNLINAPQAFDNAAWTLSDATVSANSTTAPDGSSTADTLADTVVNAYHCIISNTYSVTSAQTVTASVFAKLASGARKLQLCGSGGVAGSGYVTFDLQAVTATASTGNNNSTGAITALPNGWYLCSWTFTPIATGTTPLYCILATNTTLLQSYAGDGSGLYLWQAQAVAGSTPGPFSYA